MTEATWVHPVEFVDDDEAQAPVWLYELPEKGEDYVLGVDTAEGKIRDRTQGPVDVSDRDPDFNAVSVLRVSDGAEVATYLSNYSPPIFIEDVLFLANFYGPQAGNNPPLIVPECNGIGYAVTTGIRETGYPRIWVRRYWNKLENNWTEEIGFRTDINTRPMLVRDLQKEVLEGTTGVRCRRTAIHMASMARNRQGKDEAPHGAHDDLAFARMLAIQGWKALRGDTEPEENDDEEGIQERIESSVLRDVEPSSIVFEDMEREEFERGIHDDLGW